MSAVPKTTFYANLDVLRATAVLCVYFAHLLDVNGFPCGLGPFGVLLFFIHTSFVLMQSLERLDTVAIGDRRLFLAFWIRRIFRIYPLSIFIVLLVALFHIPPYPGSALLHLGWKGVLANLALVQNQTTYTDILNPLWSLPVEVQMYAVLPFAYLILRRRSSYLAAGMWILALASAIFLPPIHWRLLDFIFTPFFTSGILAYAISRHMPARRKIIPAWVWPIAILAAIALHGDLHHHGPNFKFHRDWFISLGVGVIYCFTRDLKKNPLTQLAHFIAEHSYGIYLSHVILLWLAFYKFADEPVWFRWVFLVITSVGVPILLYRYLERPMVLVGAHIARRLLHEKRAAEASLAPMGTVP